MTRGPEQKAYYSTPYEAKRFPTQEVRKVAETIVFNSLAIGPGDVLFIKYNPGAKPLVDSVRDLSKFLNARVIPLIDNPIKKAATFLTFDENTPQEVYEAFAEPEVTGIKSANKVAAIMVDDFPDALRDVKNEVLQKWRTAVSPAQREVGNKLAWVVTYLPTRQEAEMTGMDYPDYVKMFFNACNERDWIKVHHVQEDLINGVLNPAEVIQVLAGNSNEHYSTDLRIGTKGGKWGSSTIFHNIPGSEVTLESESVKLDGRLVVPTPLKFKERIIGDLMLEFKDGEIVGYDTSDQGDLEFLRVFFDKGSMRCAVGEFSLGTNPLIRWVKQPSSNPVLREKRLGTFHLGLNIASEEMKSPMHVDVVVEMNPEFGGGIVLANGNITQKNGKFTTKKFSYLNR